MTSDEFLTLMLARVATSITVSTVRRQPANTMYFAQRFLRDPRLIEAFSEIATEDTFRALLDSETKNLQKALPPTKINSEGGRWGIARKCLNIFLFECFLNLEIQTNYKLKKLEQWLEVPLDSLVGSGIRKDAHEILHRDVRLWESVSDLDSETSDMFQGVAKEIAKELGIHRLYLELRYWKQAEEGAL